MTPSQRLVRRFLELSTLDQLGIARGLGVLSEEDSKLGDDQLFLELFKRAKQGGLLGRLWEETESRHPTPSGDNPFDGVAKPPEESA